jgi:ribosomal protein S18 acetylase RimI-like enzyme
MPHTLLANIVWHSLADKHAKFATGTDRARRYARGFTPVIGFEDAEAPDFAALAPFCSIGEHFYCGGWTGTAPAGWELEAETYAHQMVWQRDPPAADETLDVVQLTAKDVPRMLELVALTQPGPFGERSIDMGDYYGVYDSARLVAMAGERFEAGPLREISGVCTHPDYQGRGLARRLVEQLIRVELARNQTPFLHVMQENDVARRLYLRMGFDDCRRLPVRVVSRVR